MERPTSDSSDKNSEQPERRPERSSTGPQPKTGLQPKIEAKMDHTDRLEKSATSSHQGRSATIDSNKDINSNMSHDNENYLESIEEPATANRSAEIFEEKISRDSSDMKNTKELLNLLDSFSLERIVDLKLTRFFEHLGGYYPENMHNMIMKKIEKPLIYHVLKRVGGNQVHASNILGINRNTLRKKIKLYDL